MIFGQQRASPMTSGGRGLGRAAGLPFRTAGSSPAGREPAKIPQLAESADGHRRCPSSGDEIDDRACGSTGPFIAVAPAPDLARRAAFARPDFNFRAPIAMQDPCLDSASILRRLSFSVPRATGKTMTNL
jgi:hypothetical protein